MNDIANQKEKASLFFRYAMHYGLQLGIILFFTVAAALKSISSGIFAGISNILLLIIPFVLYRYMKKYRENVLTGQITYAQAWSFGNITFFFASLISAMGIYLLFEYFSPHSLQAFFEYVRKMTAETLQQEVPAINVSAIEFSVFFIMYLCTIGMILSAIVAVFAKKKNPQYLKS